jgi:hypothetical protein
MSTSQQHAQLLGQQRSAGIRACTGPAPSARLFNSYHLTPTCGPSQADVSGRLGRLVNWSRTIRPRACQQTLIGIPDVGSKGFRDDVVARAGKYGALHVLDRPDLGLALEFRPMDPVQLHELPRHGIGLFL